MSYEAGVGDDPSNELTAPSHRSYNLNRRLHDVKTYPILSPQGSSIVLYGHENGVTIAWRGGRRLKPAKPAPALKAGNKTNGASASSEDVVMILDSDDDDNAGPNASASFVDRPEFETDPVEDAVGYPEVIQTLDLSLGTDALHLAVLPLQPRTAGEVSGDPAILDERMVFAVTCATGAVYIITLPLTPPSHDSKAREELRADLLAGAAGKGKWGEKLVRLDGPFSPVDGIAIALVRDTPTSPTSRVGSPARVVVAVHSKEASGTLRLWDVPIDSLTDSAPAEAFQTEYLPSPLTSIAFNPNPTHSTQLLAVASPQAVRIYDYARPSIPQDDLSEDEGPWPTHGSWLVSLYPPFVRSTTSCSRKPVVGADWISHGRAILALLADGQWGIWDVEGAGPLGNIESNRLFGKHSEGVRGAALTTFNASGQLEGTGPMRNQTSQISQKSSFASNDLNTSGRRDPLLSMLSGGVERLATVKGGVEIIPLPTSRGLVAGEESAVLWIGGADTLVCVIPVVSKFWDTQVRRSAGGGVNLFSGAQPSRMVRMTELNAGLLGERCCGVGAVPKPKRQRTGRISDFADDAHDSTGLPVEVLIRGESRLVIVQDSEDVETAPLRLPGQKNRRLEMTNKPLEPVNAIIVHQRPNAPKITQNFENLSIRPNTRGSVPPQSAKLFTGSFGPSQHDEFDGPLEFRPTPIELPSQPRNMGLEFMDDLDAAADAGYELDAEERDVEQEVMDLMELDSQLEQMEEERQRGTKRVFFEEG